MTNDELNFRLQVCAEAGIPYSEKLWHMLASAWRRGFHAGAGGEQLTDNPFAHQGAPPEQGPCLCTKPRDRCISLNCRRYDR